MGFIRVFFIASIGLTIFFGEESKVPNIEERALVFLIDVLKDPELYANEDILLPLDFEEDMKFFKREEYYSNGKLCLISEPEDIFDQSMIGTSRDILTGFNGFKDSLESDYKPISINLPLSVIRMDYKSYLEKDNRFSYFFTVRHHLRYQNVSLVQIHITPCEKAENPFEYTFYIYFDEDKIVNWNISIMGDFEFDIDC